MAEEEGRRNGGGSPLARSLSAAKVAQEKNAAYGSVFLRQKAKAQFIQVATDRRRDGGS